MLQRPTPVTHLLIPDRDLSIWSNVPVEKIAMDGVVLRVGCCIAAEIEPQAHFTATMENGVEIVVSASSVTIDGKTIPNKTQDLVISEDGAIDEGVFIRTFE